MNSFLLSLLLGLTLLISISSLSAETDLQTLARSQQWLRLLHYKPSFLKFGKLRSEVDEGTFFFSPNGDHDPYAELLASIQVFQNPEAKLLGPLHLQPRCSFPARYRFLKSELHWTDAEPNCPELEAFLKKVGGDEMSLVFSSAFPNSPPSMFGHTLLRIHEQDRAALLDFGINYSAVIGTDENSIAFAALGLAGGYFGQFAIVPYYMKINEYSHADSRDLWEYELNLSRSEIRTFLMHLWEVEQNALFRYYFFDENCSYRLLTMLEVAKPEWNLSQFVLGVLPAETVKKVTATPGAVKAIHYRPSLHNLLLRRMSRLNSEERTEVTELVHGKRAAESATSAPSLEAAITYYQYRRLKEDNRLGAEDQKLYQALLVKRASLGKSTNEDFSAPPDPDSSTQPDLGHSHYLLGGGGGVLNSGTGSAYAEFRLKLAYHDLLNDDSGFVPFTQVDFLPLTLRYSNQQSLWVERLGIVAVTSLFAMNELEHTLSWKLDLSYLTPHDLSCAGCHAWMLEGGPGAAQSFFSGRMLLYSLALLHVETGNEKVHDPRLTPKLLVAALAHPFSHYKSQLSAAVAADLWHANRQTHFYEFEWNHALSLSQNTEVRLTAKTVLPGEINKSTAYREIGLGLNLYF